MRRIVRIGGRAGGAEGELGGHGLAQDHGPGRACQRDAGGILGGPVAGIDARAVGGREVAGIDDVLDPERQAVQQAAGAGGISPARLGERQLRVEMGERLDQSLALGDALEAGPHQGLGREAARPQLLERRAGGQLVGFMAIGWPSGFVMIFAGRPWLMRPARDLCSRT